MHHAVNQAAEHVGGKHRNLLKYVFTACGYNPGPYHLAALVGGFVRPTPAEFFFNDTGMDNWAARIIHQPSIRALQNTSAVYWLAWRLHRFQGGGGIVLRKK